MAVAAQFSAGTSVWSGLTCWNRRRDISLHQSTGLRVHLGGVNSGKQKVIYGRRFEACSLSLDKARGYLSYPLTRHRRHVLSRFGEHQSSDCEVQSRDVVESSALQEEIFLSNPNGMVIGAVSSAYLLGAPTIFGLPGVWSGLTLFMGLRIVAGFIRFIMPNNVFLHTSNLIGFRKKRCKKIGTAVTLLSDYCHIRARGGSCT